MNPDKARTLLADLAGVRSYLVGLPANLRAEPEFEHAIQTIDTASSVIAPVDHAEPPVGHLIPNMGPYRGLASDRTVVGDPVPVYANPDGVLSLRPWR